MSTTTAHRRFDAPRATVYAALVDPQLVSRWRFPDGMTCEVHEYDARVGGAIRVSLTYDEPGAAGKTSAHTDTYHGHFAELVPDRRVVEVLEFETDDPALQGEMTIAIELTDAGDGTELDAVHEGVPPGVPPADNELGWQMSLTRLAELVEAR